MTPKEKTIARINEEFAKQGNGARINHRNGKQYAIYACNDGTYCITDQVCIWVEETFKRNRLTLEELAEVILGL